MWKWTLAYLAGAWVVYEATGTALEAWDIPLLLVRSIHLLLFFGFFVALIVAWFHGEKGRQRVGRYELLMLAGVLVTAFVIIRKVTSPEETQRNASDVEAVFAIRVSESISKVDSVSGGSTVISERDAISACSLGRRTFSGSFEALGNKPSVLELFVTVFLYNEGTTPVDDVQVTMKGRNLGFSPRLRTSPNIVATLRPDLSRLDGRLRTGIIDRLPQNALAMIEFRSLLDSLPPGFVSVAGDPPSEGPTIHSSTTGPLKPPTGIPALESLLTETLITGGRVSDFLNRHRVGVGTRIEMMILDPADSIYGWDWLPPGTEESWQVPLPSLGGCLPPNPDSLWGRRIGAFEPDKDWHLLTMERTRSPFLVPGVRCSSLDTSILQIDSLNRPVGLKPGRTAMRCCIGEICSETGVIIRPPSL